MFFVSLRRSTLIGGAIAFGMVALPFGIAYAADSVTGESPLAYDLSFTEAPVAPAIDAVPGDAAIDPGELECMAKVVHHESRGQPRRGQVAVAQTLINRMQDARGRFGSSICAVANQPGQFFNVRGYRPHRGSDDWAMALDVAREALSGEADAAAPGAMFFHAAFAGPNSFFRSRARVATIGGQVFYR